MSDLKEQVLDASVQLIAEAGLGGLSMREVARRAGVSHQAPYHYFQDKASIVAALVERGFRALAERMEANTARGTIEQRLAEAGRTYVAFALEEPVYFTLMFRPELVDLSRFPAAAAAGSRALEVFKTLVGERVGPRASPARREAMLSMHWAVVHGLAALLLDGPLGATYPERAQREKHVQQVLELFTTSVR